MIPIRRLARLSFAVALAAVAACTTAAGLRRADLRRGLDRETISRTPAEIWPEVLSCLSQRGYPLVGADRVATGQPAQGSASKLFSVGFETRVRNDGSRVVETDFVANRRARAKVEAWPVEGGTRLQVRLIKQVDMSVVDTTEARDEELELALLERIDPAAAARVTGRQPTAKAVVSVKAAVVEDGEGRGRLPAATAADPWAGVRPVLGAWTGTLADGTAVRWRFDLAGDSQFIEVHGTALLFAGATSASGTEEMGRISRAPGGGFHWTQLTSAGGVDRYRAGVITGDALVFVCENPESLPAGARVRLTLRLTSERLEAELDIAEPGADFAPAGRLPLARLR